MTTAPSAATPEGSPQVAIVGAGPTGLLLAAELGRRDVLCLLIDALDALRGWDRATVVHARSMEIFEALGLEDRLLTEGVRTRAARFQSDGEVLGELNFGASGSRYGFGSPTPIRDLAGFEAVRSVGRHRCR
jgi:2-polyprenyl-6-methoxyphenol hydroxylase-like FAD-dependent oxidoreductase